MAAELDHRATLGRLPAAVVTVDLYGQSCDYDPLLADIREFIAAEHPDRPHLIGISWGGKLAIALEHFSPGLVRSLALLANRTPSASAL